MGIPHAAFAYVPACLGVTRDVFGTDAFGCNYMLPVLAPKGTDLVPVVQGIDFPIIDSLDKWDKVCALVP